jgi:hypothetical protein
MRAYPLPPFPPPTCRVDIGGKALTNCLKEVVSHRQWNVMQDTRLVNQVKEALCFVAVDYLAEMRACKAALAPAAAAAARREGRYPGICREFVLPDYSTVHVGYVRPPPQAEGAGGAGSSAGDVEVDGGGDGGGGLPSTAAAWRGAGGDRDRATAQGGVGAGASAAPAAPTAPALPPPPAAASKKRVAPSARSGSAKRGRKGKGRGGGDDDDDDDGEDDEGWDSDASDSEDEDDVDVDALRRLELEAEADRQVLVMGNERIAVPEVLFHPADIGGCLRGLAPLCGCGRGRGRLPTLRVVSLALLRPWLGSVCVHVHVRVRVGWTLAPPCRTVCM